MGGVVSMGLATVKLTVGDGPQLQWPSSAVTEAVCVPFGIEPPLYRRRVDFYTKSRAFDISRARRLIGYAPRVGLKEGIDRTLQWYRENGWLLGQAGHARGKESSG